MKASTLLIVILACCIARQTVGVDIEQLLSQMTLKEKIGQTTQIEVRFIFSPLVHISNGLLVKGYCSDPPGSI
jgi:hypothetical protein